MRKTTLCLLALPLFAACGTAKDWREVETAPMTFGECWEGLSYIAKHDGFSLDPSVSDRGMGVMQAKWRMRQLSLGHPGRYRLHAEVDPEKGSAKDGWLVRFYIEQQWVKDLRKSRDPQEKDWSRNGQDGEREAIFAEKLRRRIGKREVPTAASDTK